MASDRLVRSAPLRALLAGFLDYAGTFPPASLSFADAVACYAAYHGSGDAWMLRRLVVPSDRTSDLLDYAALFERGRPCPVAVVVPPDEAAMALVAREWKRLENAHAPYLLEAVETRWEPDGASAERGGPIHRLKEPQYGARRAKSPVTIFIEISPLHAEADGLIRGIEQLATHASAGVGGGMSVAGKVRCGGPRAEDVPPASELATAIHAFARYGLAWKATAGLHQPFSHHGATSGSLAYGFVNLLFAGALAHATACEPAVLEQVLSDADPSAFSFDSDTMSWRDRELATEQIAFVRQDFVLGIGSCSFEEPVKGLRAARLLSASP